MKERITKATLERMVAHINGITGSPEHAYTRTDEGGLQANIGCYTLSCAYGGYSLERIVNEHGGVTSISGLGHVPARELYNYIRAFVDGYRAAQVD